LGNTQQVFREESCFPSEVLTSLRPRSTSDHTES